MSVPLSRPVPVAPGPAEAVPRPSLRLVDAVALIVGTVVGVGIFRVPSLVAANAGGEAAALLAWLAGGAVSLVGALCYAELTSAYPHAGGDYHYLGRAFGRRLAFLFGWARISVIQTGSIAFLAFVVGDYASQLLPLGPAGPAVYAALTVVAMTAVHVVGVRQGKLTQNVLTTVEVLGVGFVVLAGFAVPAAAPAAPAAAGPGAGSIGLMMVFVLLTYGGWNEAAYLSAEVHEPRRNMVRALVASILVVTALYVLVNWAYLRGLGLAGVAGSRAVAADLLARWLGTAGAGLVSLVVVVSAVTSVNAAVFTGARTAWALGRDVPWLRFLGRWSDRGRTPVNALLVQGAVCLALVLLGAATRKGFETMVEYTAPVFWLFFLLTGVALFVLRAREPGVPRPFRVPLFPLVPLVFCATCAYLLYASLAYTGVGALVGVAVLGVGALLLTFTELPDGGH
ncbi:MAG TPA: APC family permease [Methylomirabilota bacterium]|nr:APC family permease [Methylomirabilota bacterium]